VKILEYSLPCPSKINLTLRITGSRKDGMHDIGSLFYRLPSIERLTLRRRETDNVCKDVVRVHGHSISGRNILDDVLETARIIKPGFPALEIDLWKEIPPGSGLGSGSGNAAALARWLSREEGVGFSHEDVSRWGSDVPFLFEEDIISFRSGSGTEAVQGFKLHACSFSVLIVIPLWSSPTSEAYRMADRLFMESGWPLNREEAFEEGKSIVGSIGRGEEIGLLPNDFMPVLLQLRPEYSVFSRMAESSGAFAWGVGGSGSSFFCLFREKFPSGFSAGLFETTGLVQKILLLE
jgi:4-diphosphocytidyl-2-C-methyl-D-erythritol kinase